MRPSNKIADTEADRQEVVRRYVDREITAEEAADRFGPGTAIVDVILEAKRRFGRLPDRRDAFTEGEYRRALAMLGLADRRPCSDLDSA